MTQPPTPPRFAPEAFAAAPVTAPTGGPGKAAVMMIGCCALVAPSTFFAKMLGRGLPGAEPMSVFQISFGRYAFALAALAPLAIWMRVRFTGAPMRLYLARSTCGYGGVTAMFAAAAVLPLADATAISFLNPVLAMILAVIFLGERVGRVRWAAAAVALIGGALLIRPGYGALRPEAFIALLAAGFMATEIIVAKLIARGEAVLRMLTLTNLLSTCLAGVVVIWVWRAPSPAEWGVMILVGVSMVAAQALFMAVIRFADASFATPFFYATLIFAAGYDAAWFGEYPGALSAAGAGLIVLGALILAFRERRAAT